jgi:hypothetical protein
MPEAQTTMSRNPLACGPLGAARSSHCHPPQSLNGGSVGRWPGSMGDQKREDCCSAAAERHREEWIGAGMHARRVLSDERDQPREESLSGPNRHTTSNRRFDRRTGARRAALPWRFARRVTGPWPRESVAERPYLAAERDRLLDDERCRSAALKRFHHHPSFNVHASQASSAFGGMSVRRTGASGAASHSMP